MGFGINKLTMVGANLTRDAELKKVGDTDLLQFAVAYNFSKKDANGQIQNRPAFFECSLWGKLGPAIVGKMKKGQKVAIVGYIDQDRWADKTTGEQREKVKIVAEDIVLMFVPPRDNQGGGYDQGGGGYDNGGQDQGYGQPAGGGYGGGY